MAGPALPRTVEPTDDAPVGTREHLRIRSRGGEVPLGFVRDGPVVFLVARDRSSQWPIEALRAGHVELRFPTGSESGPIRLLAEPTEREAALDRFRRKYGPELYRRWYDRPARVMRVDLIASDDNPSPAAPYLAWLEAEFDNVADDYDHHITGNRMNMLLRNRSLRQLRPLFVDRHRLLEVGCGSGMETLPLLREGHEIVAVDVSSRMLTVVREKARMEGLSERLVTEKLRAANLGALVDKYGAGGFDAAYSTYGALNCESELAPVAGALARLLHPGAPFLAGVYNRWCLAELFGYSMTWQFRRAFGRRTNPVPVGASRFCIDVYAYSAWEFQALFRPWFSVERVEGVPVVLPPSDLTSYAEKFARRFEMLAAADARLGRIWPLRYLGDHFLMTMRRQPAG
ncbi:MAG: methyltransferase domain-containing protein [Thermoplasmata archaeon]|nr:methyltransferase domain-containing protein [Thermoplasmata archaeon]